MTKRIRVALFTTAVLCTLVIASRAWLAYYPDSPLVVAVGLPGPSADVGTRCGVMRRVIAPYVALPIRDVRCIREHGTLSQQRRHEDRQEVGLDLLTRRTLWARRSWAPVDSLAWRAAQDSVRRAVRARGGTPLRCPSLPAGRGLEHVRVVEHWRVGEHTERLIAYHWDPSNSPNEERRVPPWLLQIDAYAGDAPDCTHTSGIHAA